VKEDLYHSSDRDSQIHFAGLEMSFGYILSYRGVLLHRGFRMRNLTCQPTTCPQLWRDGDHLSLSFMASEPKAESWASALDKMVDITKKRAELLEDLLSDAIRYLQSTATIWTCYLKRYWWEDVFTQFKGIFDWALEIFPRRILCQWICVEPPSKDFKIPRRMILYLQA
jgi:hypothetical protein